MVDRRRRRLRHCHQLDDERRRAGLPGRTPRLIVDQ